MVMTSTTACIRTQDRSPGASHRGAAADARDWPSRDSCRHCPRHSVVGANDLLDLPGRWARRSDPTGGHRVVLGRGPVAAQRESHPPDASAMRQWIQNPRRWDNRGFFACQRRNMSSLPLRLRRSAVPGRGITTLADVPRDPHSKVLHLCRYPEKCCTVCDRHRQRCWHPVGGRSW